MKNRISVIFLTQSAVLAALYVALTLFSSVFGLAVGPFEFRLSEALAVLPALTPAAVPGLFFGCLIANLWCGAHILDVVFGSLASLLGALGTRFFRDRPVLAYLCPVLANTLFVPPILYFVYGFHRGAFPFLLFTFFVGEAVSVGVLGALLHRALLPFRKYFQ
ncbi:MAG: QueT transporter family protein [Clostridia bacterium]|nr:QueT transporter family protein [Clostridia bacterium]